MDRGVLNVQCSPILLPSDALSTSRIHSPGPFHQIATAEVASCDHGPTSWPQDCASPRPLKSGPVPLLLTSHEWPLCLAAAAHASCLCGPPLYRITGWLRSVTAVCILSVCYCPVPITGTVKVWIQNWFSVDTSLCKYLQTNTAWTNVELR